MRNRVASAFRNPAIRLIVAALLAGTAAGCSSDATRFDNMFSSTDTVTTGSIRHPTDAVNGQIPTPSANVNVASNNTSFEDNNAYNQPMPRPIQSGNVYQPSYASNARLSDAPVQRSDLSAPSAAPLTTSTIKPRNADTSYRAPLVASNASNPRIKMIKGADPAGMAKAEAQKNKALIRNDVAALEPRDQKLPGKMPIPGRAPAPTAAIVPAAPQMEKKKTAAAQPSSGGQEGAYKVASGDSLAAIARKNGISVEALKAANGMKTANLRIGQELKIPAAGQTNVASAQKVSGDDVKTSSIPANGAKTKSVAPASSQSSGIQASAPAPKESVTNAAGAQIASIAPAATGIEKYRWPVTGAVIAGYGANVDGARNDGIDISVPEGTPVKAAENGVVIYSGNGLEKLGNTVLIRHGDGTVTVYAHVKDLDVNRGDKVTRGQVIASSGMTGNASRPKLHFEVRKNSAPVNPMTFLE